MKNVQKGFTLVELIVVITILAILGTIAFISLQGYSQDAKNSKVTSDIRTLTSAIETSMTDGTIANIDAAVAGNTTTNKLTAGTVGSGANILTATEVEYTAGTVNFSALRQNGDDFVYTVAGVTANQNYIIGGVRVLPSTTLEKGAQMYQIAGSITSGGTSTPVIKGNYVAYVGSDLDGILADSDTTTVPLENNLSTSMSGTTLY